MKNILKATALVISLSLAAMFGAVALAPAQAATTHSVPAKAVKKAHKAYSIDRVRHELKKSTVKKAVHKKSAKLKRDAKHYGTSYNFERDVYVCELTYRPIYKTSNKHYFSDPTAVALSECLNATIASHNMFD